MRTDFSEKYARARGASDYVAAQVVSISDDTIKDEGFLATVAVAMARLRIDARKWLASKLAPKKYGDKIDAVVSGPNGGPLRRSM